MRNGKPFRYDRSTFMEHTIPDEFTKIESIFVRRRNVLTTTLDVQQKDELGYPK